MVTRWEWASYEIARVTGLTDRWDAESVDGSGGTCVLLGEVWLCKRFVVLFVEGNTRYIAGWDEIGAEEPSTGYREGSVFGFGI
jgi:hypothetical protein